MIHEAEQMPHMVRKLSMTHQRSQPESKVHGPQPSLSDDIGKAQPNGRADCRRSVSPEILPRIAMALGPAADASDEEGARQRSTATPARIRLRRASDAALAAARFTMAASHTAAGGCAWTRQETMSPAAAAEEGQLEAGAGQAVSVSCSPTRPLTAYSSLLLLLSRV